MSVNRRMVQYLMVSVAVSLFAFSAFAEVRLADVFSDHMVLQRGKSIVIWGTADVGEKIAVSLADRRGGAVANTKGRWQISLEAMPAGGPYELKVTGENEIVLSDVMIGEVWVCSGQSNMEWGVERSNDAQQEIAGADYPNIRLLHLPRNTSGTPIVSLEAQWKRCSPDTIKRFSAVGYFFGRKLYKELNVPIGLIGTYWGGTPIQPWTPRVGFEMIPELSEYVDQIDEADYEYRKNLEPQLEQMQRWINDVKAALENDKPIPHHPTWPKHAMANQYRPTGLYNAMIHPLVPLKIRGAIWYQGESNVGTRMMYYHMMNGMISGWRKVFGQGDFPFYYVQLAPFRYGGRAEDELAYSWEAQTEALKIPNTGMAVITDITMLDNIHPTNKQDVGLRLALWALAKDYGQDLVYSGPLYKAMEVEGDTIHLSFDHVGGGLTSRDGESLDWFTIAGEDKVFHEATAVIDGDQVVVTSDQVSKPVAVRFGWHQEATPNLMNQEGLPASPFRTDRWEENE